MSSVPRPVSNSHRGILAGAVALSVCAAGCAASAAMHHGANAEGAQDYDVAVAEYNKAAHANPNDVDARDALNRAKLRAAEDHFTRGRRAAALGKFDQALVEYELASELNPSSGDIDAA